MDAFCWLSGPVAIARDLSAAEKPCHCSYLGLVCKENHADDEIYTAARCSVSR